MKPKLTKNICQMKFMKRTREKFEKEELEVERRNLFEHDITDDMRKASKVLTESSYIICENLRFGRMSFQGFNADVEKNQTLQKPDVSQQKMQPENEGMTNEELAEQYSSVVGTMRKKFTKKKHRLELKEETRDFKKQKIDTKVEELIKPKVATKRKDEDEDELKTLYPRRKRAAEFWKPEGD